MDQDVQRVQQRMDYLEHILEGKGVLGRADLTGPTGGWHPPGAFRDSLGRWHHSGFFQDEIGHWHPPGWFRGRRRTVASTWMVRRIDSISCRCSTPFSQATNSLNHAKERGTRTFRYP
jgi:hypothetical protein